MSVLICRWSCLHSERDVRKGRGELHPCDQSFRAGGVSAAGAASQPHRSGDTVFIMTTTNSLPHTCTCRAQKPLTALSLLPVTYGVAYASTLGNLNVASMSREFSTKAAK